MAPDLKLALQRILAEHGPLAEDALEAALRAAGVTDPELRNADDLERDYPIRQLADERWVWLPAVLAGRVFTHRVGAEEATHDILAVIPDLGPITALCEYAEYQCFTDGSPAVVAMLDYDDELLEPRGIPDEMVPEGGVLLLEPGTLAGLGVVAGDLIGVRLTDQGLTLERVGAPGPGADAAAGAALAATLEADPPEFFDAAAWTACVADPVLFTEPLAPLRDIADNAGLAHEGGWLAPAGFDFDAWNFENRSQLLAMRHDLDPDDAFALHTLISIHGRLMRLLESIDPDEPPQGLDPADGAAAEPDTSFGDVITEFGGVLADPLLAELLLTETDDTGPAGAAALGVLAETLEPKVAREARVACRWLRGVALERVGDIEGAERELLAAESMDLEWPLTLFDLARFASYRGDAERGLALLHRAGADDDHPLLDLLQRHLAAPRADVGRNQPCWCGSGRKYKKCHLGREELPLTERGDWLYAKAIQHAVTGAYSALLTEVGYQRCRYVDPDDEDEIGEMLADPLLLDTVLFEGGAFAEFLELRGTLLPDDEHALAERWLAVQRSVFEVEQVHPGRAITVRDVRTGDTQQVRERAGSRQLKPGQLICTRVLPAGDTAQIFGGIEPVALHERGPLIELLDDEPDPVELVAFLTRRFAPPTLSNTEGEALVLCRTTLRIGDPAALSTVFDEAFDRVEGEVPAQWFEHVTTDGMERIRATLVLDGDTLQVETNSDERMDRVLAVLTRLDPTAEVLDDVRQPLPDAREAAKLIGQPSSNNAPDPSDPEMAAVLADFVRDYETRWLDESIPALDGHTPRQAADDPTRRGDLIRLLDSFPAGAAAAGGMDADRLRAALGL